MLFNNIVLNKNNKKSVFNKNKKQSLLFKEFELALDEECKFLSKKCIHPCLFTRDHDKHNTKNITKEFSLSQHFDWELYVLGTFKSLFSPEIVNKMTNKITYKTNNCMSLRSLLNSKAYTHLVLHELLSFVKHMNKAGLVHGNLHIDNVFFNIKKSKFFVIDLSNAYVSFQDKTPSYDRPLQFALEHVDFITLYQSLQLYFEQHDTNTQSLQSYFDNLVAQMC